MSGDRLTLTAENHGDNILCNTPLVSLENIEDQVLFMLDHTHNLIRSPR